MKVTVKELNQLGACEEGLKWFKKNFPKGGETKDVILKVLTFNPNWGNWYIIRKFTKPQSVLYALFAAEQSLAFFEKQYPEDNRPRLAIEAARIYLANPTEQTQSARLAARLAAESARLAVWSAAESARLAVWSAARSAEAAWTKILNYGLFLLGIE